MTYYARNLPHWHPEGKSIFLTWRLFGSLPADVVKSLAARDHTSEEQEFRAFDVHLDAAGCGPLWLKHARVAGCVAKSLHRGEELSHYRLHSYVVMANHVHVLLDPKIPLRRLTNSLKGVTAREANALLGRIGKRFWQDESFDHWVRTSKEFDRIRAYIENNPVSAGLASKPEDWPWSSAHK